MKYRLSLWIWITTFWVARGDSSLPLWRLITCLVSYLAPFFWAIRRHSNVAMAYCSIWRKDKTRLMNVCRLPLNLSCFQSCFCILMGIGEQKALQNALCIILRNMRTNIYVLLIYVWTCTILFKTVLNIDGKWFATVIHLLSSIWIKQSNFCESIQNET